VTELVAGARYRAIGPAAGSKLGPPPEVLVTGRTDRGYRTEGKRQTAPIILFGVEGMWVRVPNDEVVAAVPPAPKAADELERCACGAAEVDLAPDAASGFRCAACKRVWLA
jgi:hypothetical protein